MNEFWAMGVVGLVPLILGLCFIVKARKQQVKCTKSATAQITEIRRVEDMVTHDGYLQTDLRYIPYYEYIVDGQHLVGKSGQSSGRKKKYSVGDETQILYDPENPKDFIVEGKSSFFWKGIVLIAIGAILTSVGTVCIILNV